MEEIRNSDYQLIERVSKIVNDNMPVNESIEHILAELGTNLGLYYITIKEVSPDEHIVKCTYEWSADNVKELINCESRYVYSGPWDEWIKSYENEAHIWTWDKDKGEECPVRIIRTEVAGSIIQVPIYRYEVFAGCVECVDSCSGREWSENEIALIKQFGTILVKYLFKIREISDTSSDVLTELYDRTTRLPKYEYFCKEIESNLSQLDNCQLVILSIDFSNFKYVNEKYGHQEGNYCLEMIAKDIYRHSKWLISCCRSHSDNFLILGKCDKLITKTRIRLAVEGFAEEEERKLAERYFDCNLTINLGIHIIRSDNENIEQAISNANLARKFAKKEKVRSGHTCLLYEPMMSYKIKQDADYISTMSKGIENGEFFVEYQPLTTTDTLEVVSCEAVVRWRRENFYKLMPADFVPIFEKDGCIIKVDYFVYDDVFKTIRNRLDNCQNVVPVALNVNIVHFYENRLLEYIDSIQEKYQIPPELISFEMDERVFVKMYDNVTVFIDQLHERGYSVYIDNFGNGYSSLNILTSFKIDGIKIDRAFLRSNLEPNNKIIISCVVEMAGKLGLKVVTEGVENEEQRQFIENTGCKLIQGNLYSCPVNIDKLGTMIGDKV